MGAVRPLRHVAPAAAPRRRRPPARALVLRDERLGRGARALRRARARRDDARRGGGAARVAGRGAAVGPVRRLPEVAPRAPLCGCFFITGPLVLRHEPLGPAPERVRRARGDRRGAARAEEAARPRAGQARAARARVRRREAGPEPVHGAARRRGARARRRARRAGPGRRPAASAGSPRGRLHKGRRGARRAGPPQMPPK